MTADSLTRGCVHVLGRSDGILISGGENIAPKTVEGAILKSPRLLRQQLWACLTADGVIGPWRMSFKPLVMICATMRSFASFLEKRLSAFEIPDAFFLVERLPQVGIGKIDRKILSRVAAAIGLGHEVEVPDGVEQLFGNLTRLEGSKVDDYVDELTGTAQVPIGTEHPVVESNGSVAHQWEP